MEDIQQKTPAVLQKTTEVRWMPAPKQAHLGGLGKNYWKELFQDSTPELCNGELQSLWEHELADHARHSEMRT